MAAVVASAALALERAAACFLHGGSSCGVDDLGHLSDCGEDVCEGDGQRPGVSGGCIGQTMAGSGGNGTTGRGLWRQP